MDGTGIVVVEGNRYELEVRNAVLIRPGQRYWYENCGDLKLPAFCSPAFDPEKHEIFDEYESVSGVLVQRLKI